MERGRRPADDLLRRVALDYGTGGDRRPPADYPDQQVPLNIYETPEHIVIVAPMPGVEADNIDIEILDRTVRLSATLRGPKQERRHYLLHEWSYGPYERTITLPVAVDASKANASHSNGVLALTLPKANQHRAVRVPLKQVGAERAEHRGHAGRDDEGAGRPT